jgi:lipopolysaccharide export system permease protein
MARPTVRILSRYLIRQHFAPFAFALAALTALLLLNQVAKQFGNLVGKGLPWHVIAEVFVLSIPFIIAMTLPMAVLVAVLHTFSRLAADNEVTAMKAGGISLRSIVTPVIVAATVIAAGALVWNDQVLPRANHRLRTLLVDIQRKKPSFSLKEQVINEVIQGQFFLRAARIDPATNKLKDVTIYDLQDAERRRIITADSGRMAYTPAGKDLYLTLLDGDIQEVKRAEPTQFNRTFYRVNRIRVAGISNEFEQTGGDDTYRGDREMTVCEMARAVALARRDEARIRMDTRTQVLVDLHRMAGLVPPPVPPDSVVSPLPGPVCRLWQAVLTFALPERAEAAQTPTQHPTLRSPRQQGRKAAAVVLPPSPSPAPTPLTVSPPIPSHVPWVTPGAAVGEEVRVKGTRQRAATFQVEIQKKFAITTACIVFALFGIPVALRFPRGGAGVVIGTSVVVFSIYYIGLIGGEDLGDRLIVPPFLAMWGPNLICGVVGLLGLWVVSREGGTSRGGDLGELLSFWRRRA